MLMRKRLFLLSVATACLTGGGGVGPLGATSLVDDAAQKAAVIDRHILLLDGHVDVEVTDDARKHYYGSDGLPQAELAKLLKGGIGAVVLEVAATAGPPTAEGIDAARRIDEQKLAFILKLISNNPAQMALARSADDIERIHHAGKIAILLGFQNAYALGHDLDGINAFVTRGIRVFNIVHAGNTDWADSSRPLGEPAVLNHGLSALGKAAIGRLNDLGVLIDVSQLTPEGVEQAVGLSRVPVIATHSAARALVDVTRNLKDDEMKLIAGQGGVIGITAFSDYLHNPSPTYLTKIHALRQQYGLVPDFNQLTDNAMGLKPDQLGAYMDQAIGMRELATLRDYLDHIDHAVRIAGIDHVSIGSDFDHGAGVIGFNNEAEAPNVTAGLVRRGYSERDIAKIWSGNFLRVLRIAEHGAKPNITIAH